MFFTTEVNWLAILVAAVANMALGAAWYSSALFAKPWMKAIGFDKKDMDKSMREGMVQKYTMMVIASLVLSLVMAWVIKTLGATSFTSGLKIGFVIWLGFSTTTRLANWVFSGRPKELYFIDTGYHLVTYSLIGGLLAVWR